MYENMEIYGSDQIKWSVMELGCHLVKKFGTAPKQNLTESSFLKYFNLKFGMLIFLVLIFLQFKIKTFFVIYYYKI